MRRTVFLWLIVVAGCRADSAEQRLRQYFELPAGVSSDTLALSAAILNQLQRGTPEEQIAATLRSHGVGRDSLSRYYPPIDSDTGIVRVEHDSRGANIVVKSYGVRLVFDSSRKLSSVSVSEWLTGP
jgi:hypothetical protein